MHDPGESDKPGKDNPVFAKDDEFDEVALDNTDSKIKSKAITNGQSNGAAATAMPGSKMLSKFKKTDKNGKSPSQEMEPEDKDKTPTEPEEPKPVPVSVSKLFQFATWFDWFLMFLGSFCAIAHGVALALWLIIFGGVIDEFSDIAKCYHTMQIEQSIVTNISNHNITVCPDIVDSVGLYAIYFLLVGFGSWILGYGQVAFWVLAAERQTKRMKERLFHAMLFQDVAWFDSQSPGALSAHLADDITKVHKGLGDKVSLAIFWTTAALSCFIIGFVKGWKLSLVTLSLSPLLVVAAMVQMKVLTSLSSSEQTAYSGAGAVAEEVISAIRTVAAYGGEKLELERYTSKLSAALRAGIKKGALVGFGTGLLFLMIFSCEALGFWYGSLLVREDFEEICNACLANINYTGTCYSVPEPVKNATVVSMLSTSCSYDGIEYTPGVMITVFFGILFGAFGLGQIFPNLGEFASARGAARFLFDILERTPEIDASSSKGKKETKAKLGNVKFDNVFFNYPTRPEVKILNGLSFDVKPGETVALVGQSGCGKSTAIHLLQRMYDPLGGTIYVGDEPVKELNVAWLRSHIGVVSQEPVLFDRTISENIKYGGIGITDKQVEDATRDANAFDFISRLPKKFDTIVGEGGAQLSGGQKQRIAIARALVRNPEILLLDEATSALDTESEGIVQSALDKAMEGRTTIVIAHRLSTIQNASRIMVVDGGRIVESGPHAELLEAKGLYYALVMAQKVAAEKGGTIEEALDEVLQSEDVAPDIRKRLVSATSEYEGISSPRSDAEFTPRKFSAKNRSISVVSQKKPEPVVEDEEEPEEIKYPDAKLMRIIKLNAPETFYIFVGCLAAITNGVIQPAMSILFADVLTVFNKPFTEQKNATNLYCILFFVIGVISLISYFLQSFMFALSGERLTKRLRVMSFKSVLRQEIGWFDLPANSAGALATNLATDASYVQGATGPQLGAILMGLGSIGVGLILALYFSWKLTLVILCLIPLMMFAGVAETKVMVGFAAKANEGVVASGKVATETLNSFRTVVSLGREDLFYDYYCQLLLPPHKKELLKSHVYGVVYGFSQAVQFFAYALAFYYGAVLIKGGELEFQGVMRVFGCIVFSAMALGQASAFAPDYSKAKVAAGKIFFMIDRKPLIDSYSTEGESLSNVSGQIEFKSAEFSYPNRPTVKVLQGLDLKVSPGQTVALVGSSGCGKSTCIQLLERFYDVLGGDVTLEGKSLRSLNLRSLRKQLGLVSQEPVLFDRTIAQNIAYGDTDRKAEMSELIEAARNANIHDFISGLPQGYDTRVGTKGNQLSGGQKQRIAIARALLRNPKILLLDEATSALDTESEKIVQDALDRAQVDRTCIVIAHRLSTIQNADLIIVLRDGKIIESGTHKDLMALEGAYYSLQMVQSAEKNQ